MPTDQLGYGLPIRELLLVGLVSAVVALLLTGPVRMLALKAGAVAWPRGRDVHVTPTPRWGGLAMFGGVLAGLLLALQLPALRLAYFEGSTEVLGTVVAAALLVGVGLLDDRYDLDAITKFAAQVTAGGLLVLYGVQWLVFWIPLGGGGTGISGSMLVLGQAQGVALTVLVTVALVNAMNFVDGLDGLAAGIGMIASLATAAFCMGLIRENGNDPGSYAPALIAVVLAGACLGFLPHNFNPARIFMGDTGSMLVGVMLAAATTSASGKIGFATAGPTDILGLVAPLIVVVGIVFIPLLDLLLAVVRRTRAGTSPFSPDKMHLHHRLLQVGHSHRRAVLLVYLWVAVLAFGSVALALIPQTGLVLAAVAVALVVAFVASAVPHRSRMRAAGPAVEGDVARPGTGGTGPERTGAGPAVEGTRAGPAVEGTVPGGTAGRARPAPAPGGTAPAAPPARGTDPVRPSRAGAPAVRPGETPPVGRTGGPPRPVGRNGETPPVGRNGEPPPVGRNGEPPPVGRNAEIPPPVGRNGRTPPPSVRKGETPPPVGRTTATPPPGRPGAVPSPSATHAAGPVPRRPGDGSPGDRPASRPGEPPASRGASGTPPPGPRSTPEPDGAPPVHGARQPDPSVHNGHPHPAGTGGPPRPEPAQARSAGPEDAAGRPGTEQPTVPTAPHRSEPPEDDRT